MNGLQRARLAISSCLALAGLLAVALSLATPRPALARETKQPKAEAGRVVVVTVATARRQVVEDWRRATGTLEALAAPRVAAEVSGKLARVLVEEGDAVHAGQTLAVIEQDDYRLAVEQAKAAVAQAEASLRGARLRLQRLRRLVAKGSAPRSALDDAQASHDAMAAALAAAKARLRQAERALEKTIIRSPVDGHVRKRLVSAGDFIGAGRPAFMLTTAGRLRARLPLAEVLAARLKPGLPVRLKSPLIPDKVVRARISALAPAVDPAARAVHVLAELRNPGGWKPGGSVRGEILLARRESVVVPAVSVVLRPRGYVVLVLRGNKAREVPVTPGLALADGLLEIRDGLKAGEKVIAEGAGFVRDGDVVKVVAREAEDS